MLDSDLKKLAIFVNQDWFFLSHFLERALAAKNSGFSVVVICPDSGSASKIIGYGLRHLPIELKRQDANPYRQIKTLLSLRAAYKAEKPDLIWQIGLKPLLLGSCANILAGMSSGIVNAPVGMGFVFAGGSAKARLLRPVVRLALRWLLNPSRSKVVFENGDDMREMISRGAVREIDSVLIRGAGVDLTRYRASVEPEGMPVVLFAARLIWEKGVGLFVEAARLLKARGFAARFVIAGGVDADSSSAVPESQLRAWEAGGIVEWLGPRQDMPEVLASCHVFCLPTWYREGLPKVLLEAMACERAIVTTDAVGCREAVTHMENGLLVPPKDVNALADALQLLLNDSALRRRLAKRGRQRAVNEFGTEMVCEQTLAVFKSVAGQAQGST